GRKCATTSAVFEEVGHIKSPYAALEALLDAGNLSIVDPDRENIDAVVAAAKKTGDYGKLSKADVSILALARQMGATLVSDDYAVANVAATVGIAVEMSSGKGIKNVRRYVTYCSACSKAFGPNAKECPLCGNALKRKFKVTG
ncbi:MAG: NOB1 family endonuclease, partial [Nitrososphaera sp.]